MRPTFSDGARTTTPIRLPCTAWLGKSKKDWPPSPGGPLVSSAVRHGMARRTMQKNVQAQLALCAGLLLCSVDAGVGRELAGRSADLEPQINAATPGVSLGRMISTSLQDILHVGRRVQDGRAVGGLRDALRDRRRLLLGRLRGRIPVPAAAAVLPVPVPLLRSRLGAKDAEQEQQEERNGQPRGRHLGLLRSRTREITKL